MFKFIRPVSVSRKLTLVCMAFLIPDLVLMCLFLVTINGHIDFARQELRGNEYLQPLDQLLHYLPQHRQLVHQSQAGDPQSINQLRAVRASIDSALEQLKVVDAQFGQLLQFTDEGLSQRHRDQCRAAVVAEQWNALKARVSDTDKATTDADHRRLAAQVRSMISYAGDTSNLILDPDLDSYYLMDMTLLALPQMQERLAMVLLNGEQNLGKGALTGAELAQFKIYAAMLEEADLNRVLASARKALSEDQRFYGTSDSLQRRLPPAIEQFNAAAQSFIALTNRLADGEQSEVRPEEFAAAGAAVRHASFDLWKVAVDELNGLLKIRIKHFETRRAWSLLLAALAFTAAISLANYIARSISNPLRKQADELRQANETSQESERCARAIIEAAPDCVITMDMAGRIVRFNQAAERMFGHSFDAAVGRAVADLIVPPRYREAHVEGLNRFMQTGASSLLGRRRELIGLRSDGSEFPMEIAVSMMDRQGDPTFIAFISDITQRKESEEERKRLYAETQHLLASISSVLIHLDSAGVITRWNAAAEAVFGLPTSDVIGKYCRDLPWCDPNTPTQLEELAGRHGSKHLTQVVVKRGDGTERILDLAVNPIWPGGLLVLGNDRTDQMQLESSLRQAQKLESIGQLAAGIAHEINTPMQYVCGNIEFLNNCSERLFEVVDTYQVNLFGAEEKKNWETRRREVDDLIERNRYKMLREQIPVAIAESLEGAQRVVGIVRAMKQFSHPGQEQKVKIDLNDAVRSTVTITRSRWKYLAEVELDLDSDLPAISCIPAEINQVLLNLVVNAADAIGEKREKSAEQTGTITIRTRGGEEEVAIEVEDTGCGIPDEIRDRIFDPFFTTKDVDKGSGQGLAICYNVVVNKHQGRIDVRSASGLGTTFCVTLPIAPLNSHSSDSDVETMEALIS